VSKLGKEHPELGEVGNRLLRASCHSPWTEIPSVACPYIQVSLALYQAARAKCCALPSSGAPVDLREAAKNVANPAKTQADLQYRAGDEKSFETFQLPRTPGARCATKEGDAVCVIFFTNSAGGEADGRN
jgi:hypothetical protein